MAVGKRARWGVLISVLALSLGCATGSGDGGGGGPVTGNGGGGVAGAGMSGGSGGAGASGGTGGGGAGPSCSEQPCKLVKPQCGCAGGERCYFDGSGPVCISEGDKGLSEACADDCQAGMHCLDALTGSGPLCHEYCTDDSDCDAPGGLCLLALNSSVKLCTHNCDPATTTGCNNPANKCDFFTESAPPNRTLTQCTGAGSLGQGATCTDTSDCGKGLSCFNTGSESLCLQWCIVSAPNCPVGICNPLTPAIILNSIEYGACL